MSKVNARFFGEARLKLQVASEVFDAANIKELLVAVEAKFGILTAKELKDFLIFVNNVPITNLKMFRTKLNDDDEVMFLSPASGG